jgi:dethiobiotin synthetase
MKERYFLTGTDTEIGKTFTACALLQAWQQQELSAVGYKPVAAGAEMVDGALANEDALALLGASSKGFSLAEVNPVCLREAIAPHIAAKKEGVFLELPPILAGFQKLARRADRVLVEGVGGFRVPLGEYFDSADMAKALGLPVILVVGMRLGCINHALLTVEAIRSRGLTLAGWVGNTLQPEMPRLTENLETLKTSIPAPCLGILPHLPSGKPADAVQYLQLPKI